MAILGLEEKYRVLYHLCYPASSIDEGTTLFNSIVRDRLAEISNSSIDNIERLLEELDCVEVELQKTKTCLKVKSVDGITFNTDHRRNLDQEYSRLVSKLSCLIALPRMKGGSMGRVVV